jgi:hypothetical protein
LSTESFKKAFRNPEKALLAGENHVKMHENAHGDLTQKCKTTILKNFSQTPCIFDGFGIKYILGKGWEFPDRSLCLKKII